MLLKLCIQEKIIDVIEVQHECICVPGYLERLKEELFQRNQALLDKYEDIPVCFVDNVPSSMNMVAIKAHHAR